MLSVVSSRPSKSTEPEVGLCSWSTARPVVDLPQPDSPTTPRVSPGVEGEAHAADGLDVADRAAQQPAAPDREVHDEVADVEQMSARSTARSRAVAGSTLVVTTRGTPCARKMTTGLSSSASSSQ